MHDLVISGGMLVDGTGAPRRRADIAVDGGRVSAVGLDLGPAATTIDASGRIVTPGFIDVHSHIDAQAFWDTTLSPSPLHGITTMIAGNCGFSISPLSESAADAGYLMRMLARVEGMPLASLETGVPWNWITTQEYLDQLDGTLAINTAFKVGHSTVRRVVMGEDATRRTATADEVDQMCELLRAGLRAGAIGFSSSWSTTHNDADRNMVPSRYADREELLALCAVVADFPGTSLEFIPCVGPFEPWVGELMADMSLAGKAPVNWNVLTVTANTLDECRAKLAVSEPAAARGGKVVGLTVPMRLEIHLSLASGFILDAVPGWEEIMLLPKADKIALLSDPVRRAEIGALAEGRHHLRHVTNWARMVVYHTVADENEGLVGRTIGDIAIERGQTPWDALCDIALLDDLETSFGNPGLADTDADWLARIEIWRDPRAVVGASDAGAHLDMFLSSHYTTVMLSEAVVKRKLIGMEETVAMLTSVPADLYGIVDRGRILEGSHADLLVIDEERIGATDIVMQADLPAGASRLYAEATGIDHVLVNGVEIVTGGRFTDGRPGIVLRSGRDTHSPL